MMMIELQLEIVELQRQRLLKIQVLVMPTKKKDNRMTTSTRKIFYSLTLGVP